MGFQFNGLAAQVTITGGVSTLPTSLSWDKTLIHGGLNLQGTTVTDVYQAGAGNVDIITSINLQNWQQNAASSGVLMQVTDSANAVIKILIDTRFATNSGQAATLFNYQLFQPIILNSQEKIRVAGGAGGDIVYCNVNGFRES